MDESIFGDLDTMALPELPDSVWMRMLANALDPETPTTSLDLIPADSAAATDMDTDGELMTYTDADDDDVDDDAAAVGDADADGTEYDPYPHDVIPHPVGEHDAMDSAGYEQSWQSDGDSELGV